IEELPLENQQVEDTQPTEEVAQEAQLVEEKHADDDILVTEVGDESQLIEEMVENTEPVEQVAQVVEEKHGDIQPVEDAHSRARRFSITCNATAGRSCVYNLSGRSP
ncbi:unnamed protein product, partial [Brassica rapa subsp. trilocularis]